MDRGSGLVGGDAMERHRIKIARQCRDVVRQEQVGLVELQTDSNHRRAR